MRDIDIRAINMASSDPTRDQLRAILADPVSTREEILSAKPVLAKRIAAGSNRTRQICDKYGLSDTASAELIAGHHRRFGVVEAWAQKEAQALEHSIALTPKVG